MHGLLGREAVMKKKQQQHGSARPDISDLGCECGGELRPAIFDRYDFSGYAGFPLHVLKVPGLRCTKCKGETIDGGVVNTVLNVVVIEIVKSPGRLDSDQARFLRRTLGATQQELADRMGIARETVAKWECGEAISPQHDLILRVIVIAPRVAMDPTFVPRSVVAELVGKLQAVRTTPPAPLELVDLARYDLKRRKSVWKMSPSARHDAVV